MQKIKISINTHHSIVQTQKIVMLTLRKTNPQKWDCSCILHDNWGGLVLKTLGTQQYFKFSSSCLNPCVKTQQGLKSEKNLKRSTGKCLTFHLCCPYCWLRLIYCLVLVIKKKKTTNKNPEVTEHIAPCSSQMLQQRLLLWKGFSNRGNNDLQILTSWHGSEIYQEGHVTS